jgi:hypothetical protein
MVTNNPTTNFEYLTEIDDTDPHAGALRSYAARLRELRAAEDATVRDAAAARDLALRDYVAEIFAEYHYGRPLDELEARDRGKYQCPCQDCALAGDPPRRQGLPRRRSVLRSNGREFRRAK